jgi:hypothetical protein
MLRFQLAQIGHELVVLRIADQRRVEDVITIIVEVDLPDELGHARFDIGHASPR